jgi:hypothetical protein
MKLYMDAIDEVPRVHVEDMTPKRFYQEFLTNNLPVLVVDAARNWSAVQKWGDKAYLKEKFGGQSLQIVRLDRESVEDKGRPFYFSDVMTRRNNFADFWNKTVNQTERGRYSYYIKNEIIVNRDLMNDF